MWGCGAAIRPHGRSSDVGMRMNESASADPLRGDMLCAVVVRRWHENIADCFLSSAESSFMAHRVVVDIPVLEIRVGRAASGALSGLALFFRWLWGERACG